MLSFFYKNEGLKNTQKDGAEKFLSNPHHRWILKDNTLFKNLYPFLLETGFQLLINKKINFIYLQEKLSSAIDSQKETSYLLIFDELYDLLLSNTTADYGLAILAHELGHILYQHTKRKVDPLKAQFEADEYAFSRGYGKELYKVLNSNQDISGIKERLAHLDRLFQTKTPKKIIF